MQIKHALTFLLVLCFVASANAQIKYHPLTHIPNDLDARVNYSEPDRSSGRVGDKCAIIKVVHTDMNFNFDIGSMVINKTVQHPELNELWVYVPVGTNRIKITHPKFGTLDTQDGYYWFEGGLKCQSGQVYRLRLETKFIAEDDDIVKDDKQSQLVAFNVTPANAKVHIRKLEFDTNAQGRFEQKLPIGTFHYRVSADDYYDSDGVVETSADAGTQTVNVVLNHRQGMLLVNVSQQGATVKVDGNVVGTTPLASATELITGSHTVEVTCPNYRTETKSVNIEDGKTASLAFDLVNTTMFTISSTPSDATLYINGEKKSNTPYRVELVSGDYDIRLTHDKYKTYSSRVHFDSSQPEQRFSLVRLHQLKNSGYAQVGLQAGSLMAIAGTIGGYYENINVEVSYLMGMAKSEDLYWSKNEEMPRQFTYSPTAFGAKVGYGIILGTRARITPQVGATVVNVKGTEEGGSSSSDGYVASGCIGARMDYALMHGVGLFVAPEMDFALSKSPVYEQLSAVSSKINSWGNGFNLRVGLSLFF